MDIPFNLNSSLFDLIPCRSKQHLDPQFLSVLSDVVDIVFFCNWFNVRIHVWSRIISDLLRRRPRSHRKACFNGIFLQEYQRWTLIRYASGQRSRSSATPVASSSSKLSFCCLRSTFLDLIGCDVVTIEMILSFKSEPSICVDPQSSQLRYRHRQSFGDLRDQADDLIDTVFEVPTRCAEQAKEVGKIVVQYVVDHSHLPDWLLDNEFLISGHRQPMPSVKQCFASIFRLHTETVNIWTHLLGTLFFVVVGVYFMSRPSSEVHLEKKLIFGAFFLGAIICLMCSTLYHTLYCHSPKMSKFFGK